MDKREQRVLQLLRDALDTLPGERERFLEQHCNGDTPLRKRVEALLRRIADEADLDGPPGDNPEDSDANRGTRDDALSGSLLGPFRVAERIGRGGMGVVYRGAREGSDFAQQVALKLIRRGFDFDDVQARFLRERRILARLSHPNLARFIDGGIAPDGRPWFALEYVDGESITRWCDAQALDLRARIRLLLDACAAVQYAHTQLVVHRDLKPGNMLVDETGSVRLLDFGVAGLLTGEANDAERQITTDRRHPLTPEYAAPEQFDGTATGVAVDVYALGVIAYELLSGVLPYEMDCADPDAAQRTVRETPPRPLTQAILRESGGSAPSPVQRLATRKVSLKAYRNQVRGDLGRIVETALAKEWQRRYATVQAFADDLACWLRDEPVRVSGRRIGYRFGKFVHRNRIAVLFAASAVLAVLAGIAGMAWQMHETRLQRDAAVAEAERGRAVRDYVMLMFRNAGEQDGIDNPTARDVLRQGADQIFTHYAAQPATGQRIALMLAELYVHLGDPEAAGPLLEGLLAWPGIEASPGLLAEANYDLGEVELERGNRERARELLDRAQREWNAEPARYRLSLNISRGLQADIEQAEGKTDQAIATLEAAVAERRRLLATPDRELASSLGGLAVMLLHAGRPEDALQRAGESVSAYESLGLGRSSAGLAAINNHASAAFALGQYDAAIADFRQTVALRRTLHGATTELADGLNNLAFALMRKKEYAQAIPLLEEALRIAIEKSGPGGHAAFAPRRNLADAYVATGRIAEAVPLADAAVRIGREQFGADSLFAGAALATRARVRMAQEHRSEASADLDAATVIFTAMGAGGAAQLHNLAPLREQLQSTAGRGGTR